MLLAVLRRGQSNALNAGRLSQPVVVSMAPCTSTRLLYDDKSTCTWLDDPFVAARSSVGTGAPCTVSVVTAPSKRPPTRMTDASVLRCLQTFHEVDNAKAEITGTHAYVFSTSTQEHMVLASTFDLQWLTALA